MFAADALKGGFLGARHGFSPRFGMEAAFAHYAQKGRLQELEDPLVGTRAFATVDDARALAWLSEMVGSVERRGTEHLAFVERWRHGDIAEAEAYCRDELCGGDRALWAEVVDRRQQAWVPKIVEAASRGRLTVVGVGMAHVVGEDGLPALLQRAGLKVERA